MGGYGDDQIFTIDFSTINNSLIVGGNLLTAGYYNPPNMNLLVPTDSQAIYFASYSDCLTSPVNLCNNLSDQYVNPPQAALFSLNVSSAQPVNYQWQESTNNGLNWSDLTNGGNTVWTNGSSSSVLTISNTTVSQNNYQYRCIVNNSCPSNAVSNSTTLFTSTSPSSLTVSNVIAGNSSFIQPKILWSGNTNQTPSAIKICADASKATEFTFVNNTGVSSNNIRFWVGSDTLGINSDISGYFVLGDYQINGNIINAKFSHPKYLQSQYAPFRNDIIRIVDYNNPGNTIFSIPVHIYRAPVLMIHGLWGEPSAFDEMKNYFDSNGLFDSKLTRKVPYTFSNSMSFISNALIVPDNITTMFQIARSNNFSAGKVDLVAHSMGGVLSRQYIQSPGFQLKDDVHKLITINTLTPVLRLPICDLICLHAKGSPRMLA
ncbi:MAG: hypothetical protein IPM91_19840 [Bacteroidetes bacterium]|nr:hypothetical protein [Bacteroidota bacterium]